MFRPADGVEPPQEEAAYRASLQQSAKERESAKAAALEACSGEQLTLLECYRKGSLSACATAREAFWACYRRKRVRAAQLEGAHAQRCLPLHDAVCKPHMRL